MAILSRYGIYRPLRSGVAIVNPSVAQWGTLGLIAADADGSRWLVSCYHVLCRPDGSPAPDGESVHQPERDKAPSPVAHVDAQRADPALDCAAAKLVDGVDAVPDILELGLPAAAIDPAVGMRVLKSGVKTGVTEGVIDAVTGDTIEIAVPPGFPPTYELSMGGDSGALWVERESRRAVALHNIGNESGLETARATRIGAVLDALRLSLLLQ